VASTGGAELITQLSRRSNDEVEAEGRGRECEWWSEPLSRVFVSTCRDEFETGDISEHSDSAESTEGTNA
jgi:hypothetical protein